MDSIDYKFSNCSHLSNLEKAATSVWSCGYFVWRLLLFDRGYFGADAKKKAILLWQFSLVSFLACWDGKK